MGGSISLLTRAKLNTFLFFAFVFAANYLAQYFDVSNNFSRSYLDDLLALPVILYLTQLVLRMLYRFKDFKLDKTMIISGFLLVSITFEFVLPNYYNCHTKDYYDILCYAFGAIIFYFLNK